MLLPGLPGESSGWRLATPGAQSAHAASSNQDATNANVFVPGGEEAVLARAEWRMVLGLLTGGLGMSPTETDELFSVFDADGSGSLDFAEFCQVLDALPLQRTVEESPLGSAMSALQSLFVLRGQLLQRLTIEQLAEAGRIITRLRTASFDNEQAARVVQAIYLSRSREALRDAWDAGGAAGRRRRPVGDRRRRPRAARAQGRRAARRGARAHLR